MVLIVFNNNKPDKIKPRLVAMSFNFQDVGEQLNAAGAKDSSTGVSFAGRSLKLDTDSDGETFYQLSLQ